MKSNQGQGINVGRETEIEREKERSGSFVLEH
jgi:hypothetical protein